MPLSFADSLVVGISSRALFNLNEENRVFEEEGVVAFRQLQKDKENDILEPGTAFHLIKNLLRLNGFCSERIVEVIVMSRNSPETGLRVLNSIKEHGLDITRSAFTGGESLHPYIEAFDVDLFLSNNDNDVQKVIDSGSAAAAIIYDPPSDYEADNSTVRIAFDADAVIFSDESEQIFKARGLQAFHENEQRNTSVVLQDGPHAKLLKMLGAIQKKMNTGVELSPLRIAIVTARNSPSHLRVIHTLREWGVYVDEAFFLGGLPKTKVLRAFKAHIFFDDQETHLAEAKFVVPSGRVPYKSTSPLFVKGLALDELNPEKLVLKRIHELGDS